MKKLKVFLCAILCILTTIISGSAYVFGEAPPLVEDEDASVADVSEVSLVKIDKKLYCYSAKGVMIKNKLKVIDGDTYYFGPDGYALKGGVILENKGVFVFGKDFKKIRNKANQMVTVGKYSYYLLNNGGRAATGYFLYKDNLYFASTKGKIYKERYRENKKYYFTASGAAKKSTDVLLKIRCMQITSSIIRSDMTQSQKLRACWNYVVCGNIRYWPTYPNLGEKGWQRSMALSTLTNGGGNCYGFACAFAALAKEIGYEPYVVYGYVPGTRDGRSDGMTRHCWIRISGYTYDPEGQYAGWARGIYGTYGYPISHWISGSVKFG